MDVHSSEQPFVAQASAAGSPEASAEDNREASVAFVAGSREASAGDNREAFAA